VADAVERLKGSLTIVVIGHRGALTELADRHVMLEGGRIVTPG
jgi:ABC-type bacteriocin/lantibiotic exporter with double-glycine peptidase domain